MNDRQQGLVLIFFGVGLLVGFTGMTAALAPPVHDAEQARVDQSTLVGAMGNGHHGGVYQLDERGATTRSFERDAVSYNDVSRLDEHRVLAAFQQRAHLCGPYPDPCMQTGFRIINQTTSAIVYEWAFPTRKGLNAEVHDVELLEDRGEALVVDMDRERLLAVNLSTRAITWQWNASQHYEAPPDPTRTDWLHMNDVDAIGDGHYLVSVRNTDQLVIVNRSCTCVTEVINEERDHDILQAQHNPQWLGEGAVLVADSENDRVVELHEQPDGTWDVAWAAYSANGVAFDWPRDADRLANGHTLVLDTRNTRVVEITQSGEVVWSTSIAESGYDAERGGREYPAGPAYNTSGMVVGEGSSLPVPYLHTLYGGVRHVLPLPFWMGEAHVLVALVSLVCVLAGAWVVAAPRLRHFAEDWLGSGSDGDQRERMTQHKQAMDTNSIHERTFDDAWERSKANLKAEYREETGEELPGHVAENYDVLYPSTTHSVSELNRQARYGTHQRTSDGADRAFIFSILAWVGLSGLMGVYAAQYFAGWPAQVAGGTFVALLVAAAIVAVFEVVDGD